MIIYQTKKSLQLTMQDIAVVALQAQFTNAFRWDSFRLLHFLILQAIILECWSSNSSSNKSPNSYIKSLTIPSTSVKLDLLVSSRQGWLHPPQFIANTKRSRPLLSPKIVNPRGDHEQDSSPAAKNIKINSNHRFLQSGHRQQQPWKLAVHAEQQP